MTDKDSDEVYHHEGAGNVVAPSGVESRVIDGDIAAAYWKANLSLLAKLLFVWFLASFGAGILFGPFLDQFQIFGFKLGFWFAQQGSIYVFVVLIFVYVQRMKVLERKFGLDDDDHFEDSGEGEAS
jgi:putative solute:sodium symporter small subunit